MNNAPALKRGPLLIYRSEKSYSANLQELFEPYMMTAPSRKGFAFIRELATKAISKSIIFRERQTVSKENARIHVSENYESNFILIFGMNVKRGGSLSLLSFS